MTGSVEIDVEARRVRVAGGEWRGWSLSERFAFDDGQHGKPYTPTSDDAIATPHYRAFYDCGVAAARVAPTTVDGAA